MYDCRLSAQYIIHYLNFDSVWWSITTIPSTLNPRQEILWSETAIKSCQELNKLFLFFSFFFLFHVGWLNEWVVGYRKRSSIYPRSCSLWVKQIAYYFVSVRAFDKQKWCVGTSIHAHSWLVRCEIKRGKEKMDEEEKNQYISIKPL